MLYSQIGGSSSLTFLNRSFNARSLALGNSFISIRDKDPNLGINNPALLSLSTNNNFSFNHLFQTGGVQSGMLNYILLNSKIKSIQSLSLRYVDYGKMSETSTTGEIIGEFTPGDFILSSGICKSINKRLNFGIQLNLIYSQYNKSNAFATSFDFGGHYFLNDTTKSFSFVLKNVGYQFNHLSTNKDQNLPIDLQFAFSHKLKYAPFRFSYLFHHLNKLDLSYYEPTQISTIDPLTGEYTVIKKASLIQKITLHFTPQVEMLIGKNIHFRFAFDYYRRYQMALTNRPGLSGFSFGLGLNFKRFSLDYGYSNISTSGNINGLTFISTISNWKRKINH